MKSIQKKIKRYFKDDLFNHTRYRLTVFYSVLLMLFLLLFMIIGFATFYTIISTEQKQETIELASQVLSSNQIQFGKIISYNIKENNNMKNVSSNQEVFVCYIFDKNNNFIAGIDKNYAIHDKIIEKLNEWKLKPKAIKNINISYSNNQSIYIEMARESIYYNGRFVGTMYIGRDLTFYYNTLKRLLFILLGLSVVFLAIASYIGYYMAKRAMVPIIEAYERQQVFVADASHELRTPLSVMQSSIEVIEMEEKNNISDFSNSVLLDMKDEVRSMKNLVMNLLALARYDSKNYKINYDVFDLNTIANQILRTTKALGDSKNIKISLECPDPFIINGDKEKLKQLLYILLDNAIKYSYMGGKIHISLSNKTLNQNEYICIVVQDSGIGISIERQERIFDRFYRNDKNRTRETGGTGLGLAIAKSIVEAHNGKIEVESVLGKGTVFTVWITIKNII